jgi:hypothetical protein
MRAGGEPAGAEIGGVNERRILYKLTRVTDLRKEFCNVLCMVAFQATIMSLVLAPPSPEFVIASSNTYSTCQDAPADTRVVMLGPLRLGQLYKGMADAEECRAFKAEVTTQGLRDKDVIAAMNKCRIYLIDRVILTKKNGNTIAEFDPKSRVFVVVEGALLFEFKDGARRRAVLTLKKVELAGPIVRTNMGEYTYSGGVVVDLTFTTLGAAGRTQTKDHVFWSTKVMWTVDSIFAPEDQAEEKKPKKNSGRER